MTSIPRSLRRLGDGLAMVARPFRPEDPRLVTAAHNTAMRIEAVHDQVIWAYFRVHEPGKWRGERYHQEAAAEFQKMSREQAQAFLGEFDNQYKLAIRRLQNETGVDLGQTGGSR